MVPKILQYAMSRVSVHQSAALNCVRGEYHVMLCIVDRQKTKVVTKVVIVSCFPRIKLGLPPYLHIMY